MGVPSGGNDPGRFDADRAPKKGPPPAHAKSQFTLDHVGARSDREQIRRPERQDARRILVSETDRAAGLRPKNWRPASAADPKIFHHVEPPPHELPPEPVFVQKNYKYVKALESVVANYGVAGDAVRTIVQKEVFGSVNDAKSRPPTAPSNWRPPTSGNPRQILVGTPRSRPSTAASTPRPATTESTKKPRPPSRHVASSASRVMQRSASVDHVGVNKRNASITPRQPQPQWPAQMAVKQGGQLPRPPSDWKLGRFDGTSPRVFEHEPTRRPAGLRVEPDGRGGRYLVRAGE